MLGISLKGCLLPLLHDVHQLAFVLLSCSLSLSVVPALVLCVWRSTTRRLPVRIGCDRIVWHVGSKRKFPSEGCPFWKRHRHDAFVQDFPHQAPPGEACGPGGGLAAGAIAGATLATCSPGSHASLYNARRPKSRSKTGPLRTGSASGECRRFCIVPATCRMRPCRKL